MNFCPKNWELLALKYYWGHLCNIKLKLGGLTWFHFFCWNKKKRKKTATRLEKFSRIVNAYSYYLLTFPESFWDVTNVNKIDNWNMFRPDNGSSFERVNLHLHSSPPSIHSTRSTHHQLTRIQSTCHPRMKRVVNGWSCNSEGCHRDSDSWGREGGLRTGRRRRGGRSSSKGFWAGGWGWDGRSVIVSDLQTLQPNYYLWGRRAGL